MLPRCIHISVGPPCYIVPVCLYKSFYFNLEFGKNSSSSFMCHTSRTSISPIENITSHRISCCSVAFIEIKLQQKLCFNNQVLMLPSHSQRQCFKTDQVMKNFQILSVHSLIRGPNVVSSEGYYFS